MDAFWADYQPWIIGIGTVIAALIATVIVYRIGFYVLCRVAQRTSRIVDNSLLRRGHTPGLVLALLLVFLAFLPALPLTDSVSAVIRRIVALLVTACIGWLIIAVIGTALDVIEARFDINNPDNLRARQVWTQSQMLYRVAVGIVAVLTVCVMLMSIPAIRQVGASLLASAGLAGLVIGAAAQQVLKNVIAGIQLALTDPVRVQDVVIVEGEWGTVEEIRSTYIVVKIWDLRRLIVPLSYFIEQPFQNWTRRSVNLLGTIYWYVDYAVPVDRMREQLQAIVKDNPLWDGIVCGLVVTDVKERTVEVRGLISAANSGNTFDLRCQVREQMVQWLQQEYPESLPRIRAELGTDTDFEGGKLQFIGPPHQS